MAAYLHCNNCGINIRNNPSLILFSCKHIFCNGCVNKGQQKLCKLCKRPAQAIVINKDMPPNVRSIFVDYSAKFNDAFDSYVFQTSQQFSYFKLYKSLQPKYDQVKGNIAEVEANIQDKNSGYQNEVQLIKKLRTAITKKQNSPNASVSSSLLNTSSHSAHSTVSTPSSLSISSNSSRPNNTRAVPKQNSNKVLGASVSGRFAFNPPANSELAKGVSKPPMVQGKIFSSINV